MAAPGNFPFPPNVAPIEIDPVLLPLPSLKATTKGGNGPRSKGKKAKRKAADDSDEKEDLKVRKPRKKAGRSQGPDAAAFILYPPFATANTLGRATKLNCENCRARKTKCSRHLRCLSCVARNETCVWADGPSVQDNLTPNLSLGDENRRLCRLVRILSARYAAREAVLASRQNRLPGPTPTLEDVSIPVRAQAKSFGGAQSPPTEEDIVVEPAGPKRTAVVAQDSVLADAQALLALAAPPLNGHPKPQLPDPPARFLLGSGPNGSPPTSANHSALFSLPDDIPTRLPTPPPFLSRPPLLRSATTSTMLHSGVPALPLPLPLLLPLPLSLLDPSAAATTELLPHEVDAYCSLAMTFGRSAEEEVASGGGGVLLDPAFEPVVESAHRADQQQRPQSPFRLPVAHYGSPPVAPSRLPPTTTAEGNKVGDGSGLLFGFGRAGNQPDWQATQEARHRERFDRAQRELSIVAVRPETVAAEGRAPVQAASGGPVQDAGAESESRTSLPPPRRLDPTLLEPIQTAAAAPPASTSAPVRRSSWLVSPVSSQLPPIQMSYDGEFVGTIDSSGRVARDGRFPQGGGGGRRLRGSASRTTSIEADGSSGGRFSTLLRRRSTLFGGASFWPDETDSGLVGPAGFSNDFFGRVASPVDFLDDERFEPRAEGGFGPSFGSEFETGFADERVVATAMEGEEEWDPFLPRVASQVEREDLALVEEPDEGAESADRRPVTVDRREEGRSEEEDRSGGSLPAP